MTNERYTELMGPSEPSLTEEEIALGWHFCCEYDGLLVGPEMHELDCCSCLPKSHPVYGTIPPEEPYADSIKPWDI
jgi:hypothetical protein